MAAKIRLKRMGKIRAPHYRIVVADSRTKRDGRSIEEIGLYNPTENPSFIQIDSARAQYWLSVGAQPSPQVLAILKLSGDWGQFKGDKNAKNMIQTKEAKAEFKEDTSKKSVIRPRVEKKVEAPAAEVVEEAADAAPVTEDAPAVAAEAPVDSVETAETVVEESPAADEAPAEAEAPAEETPAAEAPAEETPAEDAPAADADAE